MNVATLSRGYQANGLKKPVVQSFTPNPCRNSNKELNFELFITLTTEMINFPKRKVRTVHLVTA